MNTSTNDLNHIANCLMIDTMGIRVNGIDHLELPKHYGRVATDPAIELESRWSKGNVLSESGKHMPLRVRSYKTKSLLTVEGSNSMQYVDHNIVSSNDAVMTAFSMLDAVRRQHPFRLNSPERVCRFQQGKDIEVSRIDTPVMLKIPNGISPAAVINGIAVAGIRAGLVTTLFPRETVYFDQHSQLASLKAYLKQQEMRSRRRKLSLPETDATAELVALAQSTVRLEAVFRLKHLNRLFDGPVNPRQLSAHVLAGMFADLLNGYDLKAPLRRFLNDDELWRIRAPYRSTVGLWQHGRDLERFFKGEEKLLASHRRVIKREYGIDIQLPPLSDVAKDVDLGDILRPSNFVPVPDAIRREPRIFYLRDMEGEWNERVTAAGVVGGRAAYRDPYAAYELEHAAQACRTAAACI